MKYFITMPLDLDEMPADPSTLDLLYDCRKELKELFILILILIFIIALITIAIISIYIITKKKNRTICPYCKMQIDKGANFCNHCGRKL